MFLRLTVWYSNGCYGVPVFSVPKTKRRFVAFVTAPRDKDKMKMLDALELFICQEEVPTPGDEDRQNIPEKTLGPLRNT